MDTTPIYRNILDNIQDSHLNFKIEMSPFSAIVHLKNSLIQDRNGVPLLPPSPTAGIVHDHLYLKSETLTKKLIKQESVINSLKSDLELAIDECEETNQKYAHLENSCDILSNKLAALEHENNQLTAILEAKIKAEKDKDLLEVENDPDTLKKEMNWMKNKNANNDLVIKKLNSEIVKTKTKAAEDILAIKKDFKQEIKSWKKDLGNEREINIKLEAKLEDLTNKDEFNNNNTDNTNAKEKPADFMKLELSPKLSSKICCTICGEAIETYTPKYFWGEEINPACAECKETSSEEDFDLDDLDTHRPLRSFSVTTSSTLADFSSTPSMVSNWIPLTYTTSPQAPGSTLSMLPHCVKWPNPGDIFISIEEALEEMRKMFEKARRERL